MTCAHAHCTGNHRTGGSKDGLCPAETAHGRQEKGGAGVSKLSDKKRERNRIQQEQFKTVGGRGLYCFGARRANQGVGCSAPVPRGGYMHNGNWRPLLRSYA